MSNIDKQWLQQKISDMEAACNEIPFGLDEDDSNTLASLEAEAVAYADPQAFHNFSVYRAGETDNKHMGREWMWANPDAGLIPVYTAPTAPVSVPDEATPENIEILASTYAPRGVTYQWDRDECNAAADSWNACCAAMLQGAEPVTTAYKLPDDFDFDRFNDVVWLEAVASNPHMHSPTTSTIAMVALELNKRLETGNSPVIPDGWVACRERMPKKGDSDIWLFDGEFVHHGYIWDGHDFVDWNEEYESITGITHWMKMVLPAAPRQEVKQ